ncbi:MULTISPECIES: HAMP domain-containing sensor histidine kinase [unclassified Enterococcus]|uniref:HAMP domain-containing sensor histidine kinase n=1 Tax=unclassified Enterococcus TaxID=2608891 RepID=UPI001A9AD80D|nr:ATP-binding protein [Enterococcus sp. DIV1271a]MBO1300366.1 two-component sensor histidine kinase [Enterococcus sp. DIV1271a]
MNIMLKNFLFSGVIIFLVSIISLVALYFTMPVYYERMKLNEINKEFNQVAKSIENKDLSTIQKEVDQYWFGREQNLDLMLMDKNGRVIGPFFDVNLDYSGINYFSDEMSLYQEITDKEGNTYYLLGMYSLQPVAEASQVLLHLYPFIIIISLIIGGIGAYYYSIYSTKKIKEISKVTEKMIDLDADIRCDVKGTDEISLLAQDINQLYASLIQTIDVLELEVAKTKELEKAKSEFMQVASHELKTPVASLMGLIDGMIYNVGKFKDRERYLEVCKNILQEQTEMINNILFASRNHLPSDDVVYEEVSIKEMIEHKLTSFRILAEAEQKKLVVHLKEQSIIGNKNDLDKILDNLLSNAFKYTKHEGEISLFFDGKQLLIENEVNQILDAEELSKIFQPFYRPDYSRSRDTGGTGLGLFIVQQLLDKYGWEYSFKPSTNSSMCFSVTFVENKRK